MPQVKTGTFGQFPSQCKDVNVACKAIVVPKSPKQFLRNEVNEMRALPERQTALSSRSAQALAAAAALLTLAGCAEMPLGPTVTVMPGPNKPFEVFVADDRLCRDWALSSSGGQGSDAAAQRFASATAAGVVLGAAVGALAGGGHNGAGVGAAVGGVTGAAVGSDQSSRTAYGAQRRYDIAYQQCMYAKGNQVGGSNYSNYYRTAPAPVPPAPPRPPAGIQPPPPVR
jgi:hypothetical protein